LLAKEGLGEVVFGGASSAPGRRKSLSIGAKGWYTISMKEKVFRTRTPWRTRRLFAALRRSDDPDVALLQQELDARDRQLREASVLIERMRAELEEKRGEAEALRRVGEATGSAFDHEEMLKVTADIAI